MNLLSIVKLLYLQKRIKWKAAKSNINEVWGKLKGNNK
jgi:hypothetical protein